MVSYVTSFFKYIFSIKSDEDDDNAKEDYLAGELLDLELSEKQKWSPDSDSLDSNEIPRNTACFQRTGIITFMDGDNTFIDGLHYFDKSVCSISINVKDKVLYLGYKDQNDSIVVVRILHNYGIPWESTDNEDPEETKFDVIDYVIVGEVDYREGRSVYVKDSDLKFSLDDVEGAFVPISGDWLEITCTVQVDDENPSDVSAQQVIKVTSFRHLRNKVKIATITEWYEEHGTCDRQIFFNRHCLPAGLEPAVGMKVLIDAIESNQGHCAWRVIKLHLIEANATKEVEPQPEETLESLDLEKELNLDITHPIKFDNVKMHETSNTQLQVVNKGEQLQIMNKWIIVGKKRDSQINITPILMRPYRLYPGQRFTFNVTCQPKHFGNSIEKMVIMFKGFKIERLIQINVVNEDFKYSNGSKKLTTEADKINLMKQTNRSSVCVPGVRPVKPPNFIPVRIGMFPIPDKLWSVVIGDSDQVIHTVDYDKIISRIEDRFPYLTQDLNIHNYLDRWHTLLFMEEIQENLNIRVYDMPKVFLIRCQEFLSLEVKGLTEKRPSLLAGDRVIAHDKWGSGDNKYEGFIHVVKGDFVHIKFHANFHESYSGSDVAVEFHFSRMKYRRSHQAINLVLSNLGPDVLFPSRLAFRPSQIPEEKINDIKWFNKHLNDGQKAAVRNILTGQCRPKPYCIYGPPGTGKTVTVLETILQIITFFPDSRILVATPSNSASNLITQRLLTYKDMISNSFVRVLANYLVDSDTIPSEIRPYCVSLDIAREGTTKSTQTVTEWGVNKNCTKSYVGRHRITIGTCYCLGTLTQMGFPKGHFTHVFIDEAGQAIEPETMIPLSFIDKENGQIILAGDPMQLGPVIISKYCIDYGMDDSYLSRILETYPYQKDYDAYRNGFNEKLVTLLTENYRSLQEVIYMPSKLFYNSSLVPRIKRDQAWIKEILTAVAEICYSDNPKEGGIYVYGIRGTNLRAEDSPSWYNPQEASMVALTTCKLYRKHLTADDIGIITPYVAQTRYLRTLFDSMGLPQPKIGTVEEFQGQERRIVLISTVRSSESLINNDLKSTIGFVQSPKRLNVAITRAQLVVILFCNPHLLSLDPLWSQIISYAVSKRKYIGCDLPVKYGHSEVEESVK